MNRDEERYLTAVEAENLLGFHVMSLARWRCQGKTDLPWFVIGGRIRYREEDVSAFAQSRPNAKGVTPVRPFGNRDDDPTPPPASTGQRRRRRLQAIT